MTRSRRLLRPMRLVAIATLVAFVVATLGLGAALAARRQPSAHPRTTVDTPAPTPKPTLKPTPGPGATPEPTATPRPPLAPGKSKLKIAYSQDNLRGRLPLLVAQARGYFANAGFELVELVQVEEPLPGIAGGKLDIGVVDLAAAADGVAQGLPLSVIAGFTNYTDGGATYGNDVLAAASDLVARDPNTITAFLTAYMRALRDISDPGNADAILALAQAAGIEVTDNLRTQYASRIAEFAPFDGGFGALDQGGGLDEITAYLSAKMGDKAPPFGTLVAWPNLLVAQVAQQLPPNPATIVLDPPGQTTLTIGVNGATLGDRLPLLVAQSRGYFAEAGFESIELVTDDNALPSLLGGQVDIGVVDAVDVANGSAQGLPIQAIAGYRSSVDGGATYGGDVLAASSDLLDADPGTVTAFLTAYIRGLRDVADPSGADAILALAESAGIEITDEVRADYAALVAAFAPFDGGFGSLDQDGGLGELTTYLVAELGTAPNPSALIAWPNLVVAQVGQGLPPNPAADAIGPVPFPAAAPVEPEASPAGVPAASPAAS